MAICQSARKLKMKTTSTAKSIYHKIYPKANFQKLLTAIKKCKTLVITRVGESNLYSFEGINGRGVARKLSGNQEVQGSQGLVIYHTEYVVGNDLRVVPWDDEYKKPLVRF